MIKKYLFKATAVALAATLLIGAVGCGAGNADNETKKPVNEQEQEQAVPGDLVVTPEGEMTIFNTAKELASAVYPVQVERPRDDDWSEDAQKKLEAWRESRSYEGLVDYVKELNTFYDKFSDAIADRTEEGNTIFSPVNIYLALAMLAEITDGDTKNEILSTLGTDAASLSDVARSVFLSDYSDDGVVTSKLANSLWLSNTASYNIDKLNELKDKYFASSFSGEMGSNEYNAMIQKWLNDNTGNLLKDAASGVEFKPETILALATTIYFKAPWLDEFSKGATDKMTFHGKKGDVTTDFMHSEDRGSVYFGDGFKTYSKRFTENGGMMFILPDEGTSVSELFKSKKYETVLFGNYGEDSADGKYGYKSGEVRFSVPKFDVESSFDIVDNLKAMGITSVTDSTKSDFKPVTDTNGVSLDSALHAARVKIDEEGVEAAAFTVMMMNATAMFQPSVIDFTVDRPFIFVIYDNNNVPTFVGVVNDVK